MDTTRRGFLSRLGAAMGAALMWPFGLKVTIPNAAGQSPTHRFKSFPVTKDGLLFAGDTGMSVCGEEQVPPLILPGSMDVIDPANWQLAGQSGFKDELDGQVEILRSMDGIELPWPTTPFLIWHKLRILPEGSIREETWLLHDVSAPCPMSPGHVVEKSWTHNPGDVCKECKRKGGLYVQLEKDSEDKRHYPHHCGYCGSTGPDTGGCWWARYTNPREVLQG